MSPSDTSSGGKDKTSREKTVRPQGSRKSSEPNNEDPAKCNAVAVTLAKTLAKDIVENCGSQKQDLSDPGKAACSVRVSMASQKFDEGEEGNTDATAFETPVDARNWCDLLQFDFKPVKPHPAEKIDSFVALKSMVGVTGDDIAKIAKQYAMFSRIMGVESEKVERALAILARIQLLLNESVGLINDITDIFCDDEASRSIKLVKVADSILLHNGAQLWRGYLELFNLVADMVKEQRKPLDQACKLMLVAEGGSKNVPETDTKSKRSTAS